MGVTARSAGARQPATIGEKPATAGRPPGERDVTCREFADFVLDYFDGQLAGATRARFDAHLTLCPDCVLYLRQYHDTVRAGQAAFDDELPATIPSDLVQAILDARKHA